MSEQPWVALRQHLRHPQPALCLLVGSGTHAQWNPATGGEQRAKGILSSWPSLLNTLGAGSLHQHAPPTLQWELLAMGEAPSAVLRDSRDMTATKWQSLSAFKRERALQDATARVVADAEYALTSSARCGLASVQSVISSPSVTDVISLNLDTIAERMLRGWKDPARRPSANNSAQEVAASPARNVRIWQLHGDRRRPASITLGVRRYAGLVSSVDDARDQAKQRERSLRYAEAKKKAQSSPRSWMELMLHRPLLVLGASLSESEWDLWQALVDRHRNYAKHTNRRYLPPAWILCTPCTGRNVPSHWFRRLEAPNWNAAWERLAELTRG